MNLIMNDQQPLVSVIMPVYNAGKFLAASIQSILDQSYTNFELIAVDDASEDKSWKILQEFTKKYPKIRIFRNKKHLGISNTLRILINKTKGAYLARMDADDIAFPYRLTKQVEYLKKHKETIALGGQYVLIDKNGSIIGRRRYPEDFESIYKYIYIFNPIQQPTIMIAKYLLPKNFEYFQDGMNTAEEMELTFKLFNYGKVENLSDELVMYRIHDSNSSLINVRKTFALTLIARIKAVLKHNYKPTFVGVLITLIQTFVVFLLPQQISLFIYKKIRNTPLETISEKKTPNFFIFDKFPKSYRI